jgi:HEAT repeat protein
MRERQLPIGLLVALALLAGRSPGARADRLGGNFRGPDDVYQVREDAPKKDRDPAGEGAGGSGEAPDTGTTGEAAPESNPDSPPPENGGQYRGSAGEVPPDSRQPEDGGEAGATPETGGGEASTPPPPPPSAEPAPAGETSAPGAPSGGAGGKLGKGGAHDDRNRIWPFYFESAKEEYLASVLGRRSDARLSPPQSSTWMLSLLPEPSSRRRPVLESDRRAAFRLVLGRLRDPDSHVRDAAVIALGKSGFAEAAPYLRMAAERDPDPAVREDALIALGLSGNLDEALPALVAALRRPAPGTRERRVACAALGLGLLGDRAAAEPLRAVYVAAAADPARAEDAACAATALGMIGDEGALPLFAKVLASKGAGDAVKSFTLHAAGRLGGHPSEIVRREAFEAIRPALDGKAELRQSALLALGSFPDASMVPVLVERGILDPDPSCRNFAAHSLGRIAGRAGPASREHAAVQRELARFTESDRRDRFLFQAGNLALASMACADREKDLVRLVEEMRTMNLHSASSIVLSLGLVGAEDGAAGRELRAAFESRSSGADVQAYAGLALAMADAPGTAETLAKALTSAAPADAAVARTTALALGLVGGAKEADLLVDVLRGRAGGTREGGDRFFLLGAAVQGLGIIGDGDTVEKLEPLLAAGEPWATRAFATAALGFLLEPDPLRRVSPRISGIFRHHNYLVTLPLVKAVESTL